MVTTSPRQGAGVGDTRPRSIAGGSTSSGDRSEVERRPIEARAAVVHTLLAQERERVDVAERLHEQPVQILTAVGLRLGTLARSGGDATAVSEELQDRIDVAIAQLRRLMRVLRGAELDDGLVAAIQRELVDLQARRPRLATAFDVERLDVRPSHATSTICFRLLHAALAALDPEADIHRVSIELEGDERITCALSIHAAEPVELGDALGRRLHDWLGVVDLVGGAATIRANGGAVALDVELPSEL